LREVIQFRVPQTPRKLVPPEPTVLAALDAIYAGETADSQESDTLDFKQESRSRADTEKGLVAATLCFANASGGSTVVGVRNKPGGPAAFVGTTLDPREVKQRIFEQTAPSLAVDVEAIEFRGSRLLVIRAPESPEIHADTQGRAPRRINTDCVNMSPAEQVRHREDRRAPTGRAQRASETSVMCLCARLRLRATCSPATRAPSGRLSLGGRIVSCCSSSARFGRTAVCPVLAKFCSVRRLMAQPDCCTSIARPLAASRQTCGDSTSRWWSHTNASWISSRPGVA
jgi:schlafen family protein